MSPQRAADRVGAPSFGSAQSGRGRAIAAVTGIAQISEAPSVPPSEISFNPDNPREELGDVSDLVESFTEVGQIVAITIATVDAYLASRPGRQDELESGTKFVVIDGNRRLKAAREAGLPSVKVIPGDEFVSTDESLLEAAFIANARRRDLSDLEEAQALAQLVKFYGSQHKAAKRLSMSQPLISQKLSLLSLTAELQADLEAGHRNISHVRNLAKLPPEEQKAEADRRARSDAAKKAQRKQRPAKGDNSVITPAEKAPVPEARAPQGDNSVITPQAETLPSESSALPWSDPAALNAMIRQHATAEDRLTLAKLLAQ
ncbi:ParB/RepB/Spo0J family partition protein [Streptomyces parvulus]|uniref:ParB/RepB/Spo0J family partition protein n=1 Tax=Streptomyces parvulus TaxID=146923 RepID=A0A369UZ74_9ACTN|nr:ParB/RepB/Spo0J family partition protein [Streptomyces parvulus]RDD85058.1 ParB/RepB/Spo0J family partition protein [Streptomyces parvulus]